MKSMSTSKRSLRKKSLSSDTGVSNDSKADIFKNEILQNTQGSIMVEFEYQPWKKIIVHEVVTFPLQHFLSGASLGVSEGGVGRPLMWVDGIIFEIASFQETDDIIKDKLAGIVHWSALSYTPCPQYQTEFKVAGSIRIPVIDVSSNNIFKEMAAWIKKTFEKKQ